MSFVVEVRLETRLHADRPDSTAVLRRDLEVALSPESIGKNEDTKALIRGWIAEALGGLHYHDALRVNPRNPKEANDKRAAIAYIRRYVMDSCQGIVNPAEVNLLFDQLMKDFIESRDSIRF